MFDVALFEFEGVLFETAVARRESLRRALADGGLLLPADAERYTGRSVHDAVVGGRRRRAATTTPRVELAVLRAERYFAEWSGRRPLARARRAGAARRCSAAPASAS